MTTVYLVSVSALWCAAGAAAAWKLTAFHYRSRLSEATASEARYKEWWIRDSGKMLIAEAQLDLIHQQHVDAGRKSHESWFALRDARTDQLRAANEARDLSQTSAFVEPALGFPADLSAGRSMGGTGEASRSSGQDTGRRSPADVTQRASAGNEPGRSCRRNRAGYSVPAEFHQAKGA